MKFIFDDGGAGNKSYKNCVPRAIAIATGISYQQVFNDLNKLQVDWILTSRSRCAMRAKPTKTPNNGVFKDVYAKYLKALGWKWTPTMKIGSGCKVHLRSEELPKGKIIASCSKHLVAILDGVIHDTYDCSRDETRCVYGYYSL